MSTKEKIVGVVLFIEFWWDSAAALIAIYFSQRVAGMSGLDTRVE